MAFITTIPPSMAEGDLKAAYRYMAEVSGQAEASTPLVARIIQLFSLRAASVRRAIRAWELAMWIGDEPRATRETIGAAISRLNDCHY